MLAFVAAVPAIRQEVEAKPSLPVFKPRWWYRRDRLDARPVIWSLYNHPEEWEWCGELRRKLRIMHKPSKHEFWVGSYFHIYLYNADCSCDRTSGAFQRFQQRPLKRAIRWWDRNYGSPPVDKQFASHFIHD